jgi:integrase
MASIKKRGKSWVATVKLGGRGGKRLKKSFKMQADARLWATALERDFALKGVVAASVTGTVGDLIKRYEKEIWPVKKWGDSKAWNLSQITKDIGNVQLKNLKKQVVVEYGLKLSNHLGRDGIKSRLSYLSEAVKTSRDLWDGSSALVEAVTEGIAALRRQRISGAGQPRTRRVSLDEIEQIKACCGATTNRPGTIDLAAIIDILSVLPIRIGELCKIEWKDIDHEARLVTLRRRKHPDPMVKERNDETIPLLKIDGHDTFEMLAGRPQYYERPFPYERAAVSTAFWQARRASGVKDLRLHDLRARGISFLLTKLELPMVAAISGHKDWKVMQRHYARLLPEEIHAAAEKRNVAEKVRHLKLVA